jgi:hypothetical protein
VDAADVVPAAVEGAAVVAGRAVSLGPEPRLRSALAAAIPVQRTPPLRRRQRQPVRQEPLHLVVAVAAGVVDAAVVAEDLEGSQQKAHLQAAQQLPPRMHPLQQVAKRTRNRSSNQTAAPIDRA